MNLKGNYKLWKTMLSLCRFISCDKHSALVGDVDNGRVFCISWDREYIGNSVSPTQFCYKTKTTIKIIF